MRALLLLSAALVPSFLAGAGRPTAVFTLDVRHTELREQDGRSLGQQFRTLAQGCKIVEGGAIFELSCPEVRPKDSDEEEGKPVTLALFRDLDEEVYLAGCPILDEGEEEETAPRDEQEEEREEIVTELERICADVDRGHTFSAEVENDEMRIVARGRHLPMRVFRVREKQRRISSSYELPPSTAGLGRAGPATTRESPEPLGGPTPEFTPPDVAPTARPPAPPGRSAKDAGPAKTSLRAGRIEIVCSSGQVNVTLDDAFLGRSPIRMPLEAGRHVITFPGGRKEFQLEAGQDLKLDICR